jgi:thiosulfate/3-mercaptopyruvate sulfurtransferase|eukprot:CAMPEP_0174293296 /NCGR_PEP_ID=MMETSP0809-20121228/38078_1 /TAXON_ID=73025 ORGANISM="Eutreptiella gymnastica-like, Strain CCMP1594" /NCGR_SAMPLE_ID=MMETSP0809 /ASSEMBLY_ACC=CAM_ASM_000658 /LENGTH=291 /DNA_ID=CAMNT_0015393963 /DNA_START=23 /DNA_END=898 /DNA_ORIENTATION=+
MRRNFISVSAATALKNSKFVDCRWSLKEPETYGPAEFAKGRIPNSIFVDMERDLAAQPTPESGRHPLPPLSNFIGWLKSKGLQKNEPIVCYDDAGGSCAARLWWMLRCLGFQEPTILEGGIQAWQKAGGTLDTKDATIVTANDEDFPESWETGFMPVFSVEQMVSNLTQSNVHVVDSRPAPRYNSKEEPTWPDPVAGHYPGALNWPVPSNLTEDKLLRPEPELRALAEAALCAKSSANDTVFHCGSGVTACFNIAVAEQLGLGVPRLYVGSWSQWCKVHPTKVQYGNPAEV